MEPRTNDDRPATTEDALARIGKGQVDRREAVRLLAGLGLGALGLGVVGVGAVATRASGAGPAGSGDAGHRAGKHGALLHAQGTATVAQAPQPGERPDGTHLWRVRVAGMDMENGIDLQSFFPRELTINAGDAVFFEFPTPPGFHTVTFLSGGEAPPLFVPDAPADAATASPAAAPPKLIVNPEVAFPTDRDSYDGTGYVNAGLDVVRLPGDPPFVLTFTTPGTYEYRCIPHGAVMTATVVVQAAGSPLPEDQAAVDARADQERAALLEEGKALAAEFATATATPRDDGSTLWEIAAGTGEGRARVMRFLPETLDIKVGDTVRWVNRSVSEPHTVTFLGGAEQPEDVSVEPQPDGPPKIVQNPLTLFPQGVDLAVGGGYINSGFLGALNGEPLPGGTAFELTFDAPGDYPYYCVLHASGPEGPGMVGTIAVSA